MEEIKPLAVKLALLVLLLVGINYVYKYTFFENDLQEHSPVINLVRKVINEKATVVYLGESSNFTFLDSDKDKRKISDFVSDYYPRLKFGSITKEASHAGIYLQLLKNIPENAQVKTVIVTLNLRSFDANWIFSNLETPLQKSMVLLYNSPPLFNRFLLSFKYYDIKTDSERVAQFKDKWLKDKLKFPFPFAFKNVVEWDSVFEKSGIRNPDSSKNYPLTQLACHYIKTYAFQINPLTNPRIKDFDNIVKLAKERNWNLVFNLLAENTEKANYLVGKELMFLIKTNRDFLMQRYNRNGVLVVDNLEAVDSAQFIDKDWTTEHYAENGRKVIAKNIAIKLKSIYPTEFTMPVRLENRLTEQP